jgi:HlyD family secretion protein
MLRKKNSEPAQQPDAQQELLDFEDPAVQPGKKDPKQFLKRNWKKITAVVCVAAVAAAVLLPQNSKKAVQASTQYMETALERRDITNTFSGSGTISAANTYTVKSLVKGTVLTADFEVGDTIKKGTVLYTIDSCHQCGKGPACAGAGTAQLRRYSRCPVHPQRHWRHSGFHQSQGR